MRTYKKNFENNVTFVVHTKGLTFEPVVKFMQGIPYIPHNTCYTQFRRNNIKKVNISFFWLLCALQKRLS